MNVYEIITARILAQLEQGVIPWHRPWRSGGVPKNLLSQKPYRGVNVWLLVSQPYISPYWLTFVQAQEIGGRRRLILPPDYAYGSSTPDPATIPPNATLLFEVTLNSIP